MSNVRTLRTVRNTALLVGLVAVVVAGFALLIGKEVANPTKPGSYGPVDLPASPAGPDFAALASGTQVPSNVLGALEIPAGSTVISRSNQFNGTFDSTVTYTSAYSPAQITKFFPAEMAASHWRVIRSSNPVLGLIAGGDGNDWELGVTVSGLGSASGAAQGHPPPPDGAQFKMELYTYIPGD